MELQEKVRLLVNDIAKNHKYSMSHIYGLYNEVFGVAEMPQSCASCLIRKVNQLKTWLNSQDEKEDSAIAPADNSDSPVKPNKRGRKSRIQK